MTRRRLKTEADIADAWRRYHAAGARVGQIVGVVIIMLVSAALALGIIAVTTPRPPPREWMHLDTGIYLVTIHKHYTYGELGMPEMDDRDGPEGKYFCRKCGRRIMARYGEKVYGASGNVCEECWKAEVAR